MKMCENYFAGRLVNRQDMSQFKEGFFLENVVSLYITFTWITMSTLQMWSS